MRKQLALLCVAAALALWLSPPLLVLASRPSTLVPSPMPELETRCVTEGPATICFHRAKGSKSNDAVIHFHGRRGSAQWWNDSDYYSSQVYDAWRELGVDPPIVASVSFGPLWLLTDSQPESLLRIFNESLVPRIEREVSGELSILGESMGGVNALLVGLRTQGFARVASLCPVVAPVSPYSWDAAGYLASSSVSLARGVLLLSGSRHFFADEGAWLRNDPVTLAEHPPPGTRFYLSCGTRDAWGCEKGSQAIVDRLRARQSEVEWQLIRDGGHCAIDARSLAAFLVR